jgi:hypothetical protein
MQQHVKKIILKQGYDWQGIGFRSNKDYT